MRLADKDIEEIVGGSAKNSSGQSGGPRQHSFSQGEVWAGEEKIRRFVERQKVPLIFLTVAVFLLGLGVAAIKGNRGDQEDKGEQGVVFEAVERTKSDASIGSVALDGPIFVDVAGAVEKPGVYELAAGARVKDALVASGGLAAEADREFVARSINLAAPILDGAKIYIPAVGELDNQGNRAAIGDIRGKNIAGVTSDSGLININAASSGELEKLKGIGAVRAQEIIDNRPYSSIEELRSKGVLGPKTFEKIKDEITVY